MEQPERFSSHGKTLVAIIQEGELFAGNDGHNYATITLADHKRTYLLESPEMADWLRMSFYQRKGEVASASAIADALKLTNATIVYGQYPQHPVYMRVGGAQDRVFLDLGRPAWEVVEVRPGRWFIDMEPTVKFTRTAHMRALPIPTRDGSWEVLERLLNVRDRNDLNVIVGWLLCALRPVGPYPVLVLQGEHGSAKSTAAKLLRSLVDPNAHLYRSAPWSEDDLLISARSNRVLSFDNLSGLPDWLSDALCRLSTGGGYGKRKLYSDSEEVTGEFSRPVIINGIDDLVVRGDLLDRSFVVELPRIGPDRWTERESELLFDAHRPGLLGKLLDAASGALANVGTRRIADLPRLADCVEWVSSAEEALCWSEGTFGRSLKENAAIAQRATLESSPLLAPLLDLSLAHDGWRGTATALLQELSGRWRGSIPVAFPRGPVSLSRVLRRLAPALRNMGVIVEHAKADGERIVCIRRAGETAPLIGMGHEGHQANAGTEPWEVQIEWSDPAREAAGGPDGCDAESRDVPDDPVVGPVDGDAVDDCDAEVRMLTYEVIPDERGTYASDGKDDDWGEF